MNPTIRSLLAEISPNWLRARTFARQEHAALPDDAADDEPRVRPGPMEPASPRQTLVYRPPARSGNDIASNM